MKRLALSLLAAVSLVVVTMGPAQADHAGTAVWRHAPWVATDCANVDCGAVLNAGNAWTAAGFRPGFLGTAWTGCDVRITAIVICADDANGYAGGYAEWATDGSGSIVWARLHINSALAAWGTSDYTQCVITHELGHAIGLNHTADPRSPMFATCSPERSFPDAHDAEALTSMYG